MFEENYPTLANWIESIGWIEIGPDHYSYSILRIINHGGMVWEDKQSKNINDALQKGEEYLKQDFEKDFGYRVDE